MRLGQWLGGVVFLLIASGCLAEESTPPDFSEGFTRLTALGLPQLPEGTTWSTSSRDLSSEMELPKQIKGNAWILPAAGAEQPRALFLGGVSFEAIDPAAEGKPASRGLLGRMLGDSGKKEAAPPVADLAKDVASLCAGLEKMPAFDDEDAFRQSWNRKGASTFGPLLLFAAQIHQTGQPELANQLVLGLFKAAPSREVVVNAAIYHLGEQLYEKATRELFEQKNWKNYHRELASLVEKLPRGWDHQPAVAMLLEPLAKRAAGEPPAVPKLEGIEIQPAALQSIAWMLDETSPKDPELEAELARIPRRFHAQFLQQRGHGSINVGNWLLENPEKRNESGGPAAPTVALGMQALPVLAALLTDSYPVARPNPSGSGRHYFSSNESPLDRAIQHHATMHRPASRGDLAKHLLLATLPDTDGQLNSLDAVTLQDTAVNFWKRHNTSTREELALAFLAEGSSDQAAGAAQILATSLDPKHHQALETHILSDPLPASKLTAAQSYIQQRKAAAKPFFDRYATALREETGDGADLENNRDLPHQLRQAGGLDQILKQMEAQVAGKSPQARAREIAVTATAKDAQTAIPAFFQSLADEPRRRVFLALLAGALAAKDPEVRATFLNFTFRAHKEPETDEPAADRTVPSAESKVWKQLLADDREIPNSASRGDNNFGRTLGDLAAIAYEYSVSPKFYGELHAACRITGRTLAEVALPRATARVNGETLPTLPDASQVSTPRLTEIVATAGAKAPPEIQPYLQSLTDNERAAWLAWIEEPGELAIPKNVLHAARTITVRLARSASLQDMPGILGIDTGFELNRTNFEAFLQQLAGNVADHSKSYVEISPAPFPPGLQLLTTKIELEAPASDEDDSPQDFQSLRYLHGAAEAFGAEDLPEKTQAIISASIHSESGNNAQAAWRVVAGKAIAPESGQSVLDSLENATSANAPLYLQLQILSRADAEKLKESD